MQNILDCKSNKVARNFAICKAVGAVSDKETVDTVAKMRNGRRDLWADYGNDTAHATILEWLARSDTVAEVARVSASFGYPILPREIHRHLVEFDLLGPWLIIKRKRSEARAAAKESRRRTHYEQRRWNRIKLAIQGCCGSKYRDVVWCPKLGKWQAKVYLGSSRIARPDVFPGASRISTRGSYQYFVTLGYYKEEEQANWAIVRFRIECLVPDQASSSGASIRDKCPEQAGSGVWDKSEREHE